MPPALFGPWLAWWRLAAATSWGALTTLAQLTDTRPIRTFWSTEMTRAFDRSFRSPEFLELMAAHLRATAQIARFTSQFGPK
jgi:hypothetical protein